MMRTTRLLITSALLICTSGAFAAPATQPNTEPNDKLQMQLQAAKDTALLPVISLKTPGEVLHLAIRADMLCSELLLKNLAPMQRLALPNSAIIATLQIFPSIRAQPGTSRGFLLLLRDFSPPRSLSVWTTVIANNGGLQVARDSESGSISSSIQLIQDQPPPPGGQSLNPNPVRLVVTSDNGITQRSEIKVRLTAPTFAALCRDHPAEIQTYLRPIFHDLGQESAVFAPDPAAAWQVLADDWTQDHQLIGPVKQAIVKFDSEEFQVRRSAAQDLHQMGEPAALTLMRVDRSNFTAAQNSGVDTFLAPYLPLSPGDAARLGRDPNFLLDVQYCSDVSLRKLAATRLAKLTGKPLGFDPAADDQTRLEQVARLRSDPPTTTPTAP